MAGKQSVLTHEQLQHLQLERFIFHIIRPDRKNNPVIPLAEVILTDDQKTFFTNRLRDAGYGTQFSFREDAIHLKEKCIELLEDIEGQFVPISRHLAEDFAGRHRGNMSAGVLVVSVANTLLTAHTPVTLIFLGKLDHKQVLQYVVEEGEDGMVAHIEEVVNTLVEDPSAVQKSAIIDVGDSFAWDALAWERRGKSNGELTDYFRGFLGVHIRETPSELTRRAVSAVRKWAATLPGDDLPEGDDVLSFKQRAVQYMRDRDAFKTDEFVDTVIRDEDVQRKAQRRHELLDWLAQEGIAGQSFVPKPESLSKPMQKAIYETAEGVKIEFSRTMEDAGVRIQRDGDAATITIHTARLNIKS